MIELKYYLDKQMLMTGAKQNFMKRHMGWYIYSIVTGIVFISVGVYFASQGRSFEVLPYVLITCGVLVLLKKQFYLRKVAKGVLASKPERQEVHCKFSEDEI